ncbi:hypothetical protein [Corynebacterium sp.]|uniref:hypothetical protein n=1 Tax=Corynebacterium sp. TaxID=1720 RepID=UPI0025C2C4A7|nr:hypothetical protein [Corynebacterium sp.]
MTTATDVATPVTPTRTLLRYEWLRTRGLLAVVLGLAALAVLFCTVLLVLDWTVFSTLAAAVGMMVVMGFTPVMQIVLAVDYWRSSYGASGYLTQTIPAKGGRIFAVKMLWAVVVTTASLVVTALLGCVLWTGFAAGNEQIAGLGEMLGELRTALRDSSAPGWLIAGGLVGGYLATLVAPVQYYFSISVGKERRLQTLGAGGPVLVFLLLGMVSQLVAVVGMFAVPVGITGDTTGWSLSGHSFLDEISRQPTAASPYESVMPLGFIPPMVVLVLFCLWRTAYSWNRKVELE